MSSAVDQLEDDGRIASLCILVRGIGASRVLVSNSRNRARWEWSSREGLEGPAFVVGFSQGRYVMDDDHWKVVGNLDSAASEIDMAMAELGTEEEEEQISTEIHHMYHNSQEMDADCGAERAHRSGRWWRGSVVVDCSLSRSQDSSMKAELRILRQELCRW